MRLGGRAPRGSLKSPSKESSSKVGGRDSKEELKRLPSQILLILVCLTSISWKHWLEDISSSVTEGGMLSRGCEKRLLSPKERDLRDCGRLLRGESKLQSILSRVREEGSASRVPFHSLKISRETREAGRRSRVGAKYLCPTIFKVTSEVQ